MFERCINLFLNQYESYMLYEVKFIKIFVYFFFIIFKYDKKIKNMLDCTIVFDHELTNSTLKSTKTNNLSDLNHIVSTKSLLEELRTNGFSKIISVQTINGKLNSCYIVIYMINLDKFIFKRLVEITTKSI